MKIARKDWFAARGAAVALAMLAGAHADGARAEANVEQWQPVQDARLAGLTGRYQGIDGVTIAFAIEVEGIVNGVTVAQKSITGNPLGLSTVTPQSLAASAAAVSKAMTLVLQNSADQQSLQMRTVLNVSLTELAAVRALQSQYLIASWQTSALRP